MLSIINSCGIRFDRVTGILSHKGVQHRLLPALDSIFNYSASKPICPPTVPKDCGSSRRDSESGSCGKARGPSKGSGNNSYTYKPYVKPCPQDHDHKNMSLKRPMSPHLTIFTLTSTAAMSIFQRATGTILAAYALLLAGGTLFLSNGVETYVSIIQSLELGWFSTFIIKILLGAPFAYHYFNGIRFCMWNAARWMTMQEVNDTGKKAIIATAVLTLLFAFM